MAQTLEAPRILTVNTDPRWPTILHKRFTNRKIAFERAEDTADAIERLNSGDFTAVVMDGLKGEWRMMVDEAVRLDVRPVVLSGSTVAVHEAQVEGIAAFHKSCVLEQRGIEPVIQAAIKER